MHFLVPHMRSGPSPSPALLLDLLTEREECSTNLPFQLRSAIGDSVPQLFVFAFFCECQRVGYSLAKGALEKLRRSQVSKIAALIPVESAQLVRRNPSKMARIRVFTTRKGGGEDKRPPAAIAKYLWRASKRQHSVSPMGLPLQVTVLAARNEGSRKHG